MNLSTKVLIAGALIMALMASPLRSGWQEMSRMPAPDFQCKVWLNSPPLTLHELRGKVVLIDFWEYTCINCIRTFPYLRRWNQLYGPLGLVVIGVHTPEFDFAKDPVRVADAAKRFKFTFPIAVDSDQTIWDAFSNQVWPAKYLIDKDGRIAFTHLGEGDYADFERHIQQLLKEANPKLAFNDPKFDIPPDLREMGGVCQQPTPETYLGFTRAESIANQGGYQPLKEAVYSDPGSLMTNEYALGGRWWAAPEFVRHVESAKEPGDDYLDLKYHAKAVYLVAGSDDGSIKPLYVTQDGKPLPKDSCGVDVKIDSAGRTYIALGPKRMYYVVNNPHFEEHTLRLSAAAPAISLYSFTFGNECENSFDHS
ncbi:MAG: redoxin family protein [Candidatus Binataceae bacterium]|jgi:thiol-disulfide isomerase/thioredoxin